MRLFFFYAIFKAPLTSRRSALKKLDRLSLVPRDVSHRGNLRGIRCECSCKGHVIFASFCRASLYNSSANTFLSARSLELGLNIYFQNVQFLTVSPSRRAKLPLDELLARAIRVPEEDDKSVQSLLARCRVCTLDNSLGVCNWMLGYGFG